MIPFKVCGCQHARDAQSDIEPVVRGKAIHPVAVKSTDTVRLCVMPESISGEVDLFGSVFVQ